MQVVLASRGRRRQARLEDAGLEPALERRPPVRVALGCLPLCHFGCSYRRGTPDALGTRPQARSERGRAASVARRRRCGARIDSARWCSQDRTIKAEIEAGRIALDPFDEAMVQPSSVDVRVDRSFRVFHNARYPFIDVRQPMEDLTEAVEISDDDPFILHPGEFVLGQTLERVRLPDDIVARLEGKSSLGRLGLLIHSTAGFVDAGLRGQPDARALERRQPAGHDLLRDADRPDLVHAHGRPGRAPLRLGRGGQQVPGPGGADARAAST